MIGRFVNFRFALCAGLLLALNSAAHAADLANPPPPPVTNVDVALVMAMDISGSIDFQEAELQSKGISDAFRSKEVLKAIQSGSYGRIAVSVVRFNSSAYGRNSVPIIWRIISDQKSAVALAQEVENLPHESGRGTSISDGLDIATRLLVKSTQIHAMKQVIDVSGDGPNNAGRPVLMARDEALAAGIVINGLPIVDESTMPDLDAYYKGCVIGGPGSFVLVAKGFADFGAAIRRKLVLEISSLTPNEIQDAPHIVKVAAAAPARPVFPSRPLATNPPYAAGCDFPMFGGFGNGFGNFGALQGGPGR